MPPPRFTRHLRRRLEGRGIPARAVRAVLAHGLREPAPRGGTAFVVTHDVAADCDDLADWSGLRVVVAPGGAVMTAYRRRIGPWRPRWADEGRASA
jgi:hypothetical protein